jgi:hypothetical protein
VRDARRDCRPGATSPQPPLGAGQPGWGAADCAPSASAAGPEIVCPCSLLAKPLLCPSTLACKLSHGSLPAPLPPLALAHERSKRNFNPFMSPPPHRSEDATNKDALDEEKARRRTTLQRNLSSAEDMFRRWGGGAGVWACLPHFDECDGLGAARCRLESHACVRMPAEEVPL